MKKATRKTIRGAIVGIVAGAAFAFVFAFFMAHISESLVQSRQMRDTAIYAKGLHDGQRKCNKRTLQPNGVIEGVCFAEQTDTCN